MVAPARTTSDTSASARSPEFVSGGERLKNEQSDRVMPIGGERTPTIERQIIKRSPPEPDSTANWDRLLRSRVGKLSCGLSPPGLALVFLDWLLHLGFFAR